MTLENEMQTAYARIVSARHDSDGSRWYPVPAYRPPGRPAPERAQVLNEQGELVAEFERLVDAEEVAALHNSALEGAG